MRMIQIMQPLRENAKHARAILNSRYKSIYIMKSGLFCISWPHFVCFSWTVCAFESLCKQSSRAATRVTRKMRALRTIESCSTLSRNAILSLLPDGKKTEDRLFAHPSTGRVPRSTDRDNCE